MAMAVVMMLVTIATLTYHCRVKTQKAHTLLGANRQNLFRLWFVKKTSQSLTVVCLSLISILVLPAPTCGPTG